MSISYLDIPPTYINKKDKQVYYYRRRTNSDGTFNKYVYLHDNEKHQIIAWLNRFVVDVTAKQVVDHTFCEVLFERTKELPVSKVSKKILKLNYNKRLMPNKIVLNAIQTLPFGFQSKKIGGL